MHPEVLAYIFSAVIVVAVLFQLALMCGAPWGHLAMGGRFPGRFPTPLRIAALVQSIVLSGFAVITLAKAGVLQTEYTEAVDTGIWVVTGVSVLSFVMNMSTPSKWERILWAPVALIMLLTSGALALQYGV